MAKDDGKLSKDYCEKLANKITSLDDLPAACKVYANVVELVKSKAGPVDPFAGMAGGQAVSARSARSKGRENRAQLQRRLTTTGGRKQY